MSLFTLKNFKKAWKCLHSNETAVIAVLSLAIVTSFTASSSLSASAIGRSVHRAAPMTEMKSHPVRPVITRKQKRPVMIKKEVRRAASSTSSVSDAE